LSAPGGRLSLSGIWEVGTLECNCFVQLEILIFVPVDALVFAVGGAVVFAIAAVFALAVVAAAVAAIAVAALAAAVGFANLFVRARGVWVVSMIRAFCMAEKTRWLA